MKIADRSSITERFVLLRHEMPPTSAVASHWDLMLEEAASLFTLRLACLPLNSINVAYSSPTKESQGPRNIVDEGDKPVLSAVRLADHRKKYLDYEGAVSGNRGNVTAVARGLVHMAGHDDPTASKPATDGGRFAEGGRIILRDDSGQLAELVLPCSRIEDQVDIVVLHWSLS